MSGYLEFVRNNQNNNCCCCNNTGFNFGFNMPLFQNLAGGVFCNTIYGMIHGDYRFYNPVMPMQMFYYMPNGGAPMMPGGGCSFDSNLFWNLMGATQMQMNQQNFFQSMNNGIPNAGNMAGAGNMPGLTLPWQTPSVTPGSSNTNNSGLTEAEKEAEKTAEEQYKLLFDFVEKYAKEEDASEITRELDKIKNKKIEETNSETGKTTTRNARYTEKLALLKTLYNQIKNEQGSSLEKFIVSENSGLKVKGNGIGSLNDADSLINGLLAAGYEEKNSTVDSYISKLKDNIDTITTENMAQTDNIVADLESGRNSFGVLDVVSSFNSTYSKDLVSYISSKYAEVKRAGKNTDLGKNRDSHLKALENTAKTIRTSLVNKANQVADELDDTSKKELEKLVKNLTDVNVLSGNSFNSNFVTAFNKLYAATRIVATKSLVNKLDKKYQEVLPGQFDFINQKAKDDIKSEFKNNESVNSIITTAEKLSLKTRKPLSSAAAENAEEKEEDREKTEGGEQGSGASVETPQTTVEKFDALADENENVTRKVTQKSQTPYYKVEMNDGKISYFMVRNGKILEFDNSTKKFKATNKTFDDIETMVEEANKVNEELFEQTDNTIVAQDGKKYNVLRTSEPMGTGKKRNTKTFIKYSDGKYHECQYKGIDIEVASKAYTAEELKKQIEKDNLDDLAGQVKKALKGNWMGVVTDSKADEISELLASKQITSENILYIYDNVLIEAGSEFGFDKKMFNALGNKNNVKLALIETIIECIDNVNENNNNEDVVKKLNIEKQKLENTKMTLDNGKDASGLTVDMVISNIVTIFKTNKLGIFAE